MSTTSTLVKDLADEERYTAKQDMILTKQGVAQDWPDKIWKDLGASVVIVEVPKLRWRSQLIVGTPGLCHNELILDAAQSRQAK